MKKNILWIIGCLFALSLGITSCEETDSAADPYFNWEERNQLYIDSIAQVARANPAEWKVFHTYKSVPSINELNPNVNDYVYCKVLSKGTGIVSPVYTDNVSTHYRGRLIPLYNGAELVFDQSYKGNLNPEVAMPVEFSVGGVIEGWTTALQNMVEGDRWEVYIPYDLAYGTSGSGSIPGYSTLIFDMQLVEVKDR